MSDKQNTAETGWFRKGNRKVIALATVIAIAIGGVYGVQAFANSKASPSTGLCGPRSAI